MRGNRMDRVQHLMAAGVLAIFCGWCACACAKEHEATRALQDDLWDAAPRPRMPIAPSAGPITVDGKLNEPAWQKASAFGAFIRVKAAPGNAVWGFDAAEAQTKVFVCYDASNLYLGWEMEEPYVHVLKAQSPDRDGSLWFDDCVEFFVAPESETGRVIHFIWNGLGQTYDSDTKRQGKAWNCEGLDVKASRDEKGFKWFVEVSIPLISLDAGEVKPGTLWWMSLGRERYASSYKALVENSLWNGQPESGFEMPSRFGEMLFGDMSMRDISVPAAHLGTGKISFSLCSSRKRNVTVEAFSTANPGKPVAASRVDLAAGAPMPVTLEFANDREGPAILYVTVSENGRVLGCLRRAFYVAPLSAGIERHMKRMETVMAKVETASALYTNVAAMLPAMRATAKEVAAFRMAQAGKPFTDESRARWDALSKRVDSHSGVGTYVAWGFSPWLKSNQQEMPQTLASGVNLVLNAAQDEVEYGAFMLSNLTGDPLCFRLANLPNIPNLTLLGEPIPTMKEIARNNPSAAGMLCNAINPDAISAGEPSSAAPMLTLNEWGEVLVPPNASKRVFVRVDTHGVKPGSYGGSCRIVPLNQEYAPSTLSVKLTVWPFAIPAETPLALYLFDYAASPAALDDLRAHRVSHYLINCDAERITNAVAADQIRAKRERGKLIGSYGIIHAFEKFAETRGIQRGTVAYTEAFAKYLNDWVDGVTAAGVKLDDLALQHFDEPYGEAIEKIVELGPVFRKEHPNLKLVVTCMTPFEELREIAPFCDIYGFRGAALYEPFTSFLHEEKQKGKQVWSFTCACPVADQAPLSYWRMRPWWCYKQGMDGIMIFAWYYLIHQDPFQSLPRPPVPTLGYEAIQQGMEDFCLLVMLRDLAEKAEKAGHNTAAIEARTVLDAAITEVVRQAGPTIAEATLAERLERHRALVGERIVALRKTLGMN